MKELILEKLNKMEDLEQRRLLKNIVSGIFSNLVDYQEKANLELTNRVFAEIEDLERKYDIFIAVCPKKEVDPIDEFMYPVFPEEMEERQYQLKEIVEQLAQKESFSLFTVFMNCDYLTSQEITKHPKEYWGKIITAQTEYPIKIRLEPDLRYFKVIEDLYYLFQKNNITWKTVNNPYANKFFRVIITECIGTIAPHEEIKEISIDLAEYEQSKLTEMILMWNIERLSLKSIGFPTPAIDKVNYEHLISLKKSGLQNGYLIDEKEDLVNYIKRNEEELTVVSPVEKAGVWNVLKITQAPLEYQKKFWGKIVSNRRKNSFLNNFALKYNSSIRTKGEINRLVNSFEVSEYFQLKEVEILPNWAGSGITYDLNYFIIDDIRVGNDRKVMLLKFETCNNDSIILYDLLSFIISEIQMYFPDYQCTGELV